MNKQLRECRFCLQRAAEDKLIWPCKCTGTMSGVHHDCMKLWLKARGSRRCEVCRAPLKVRAVYPSITTIITALTKSLWRDKRKLLRIALFAVYSKFIYSKLRLFRTGIVLITGKNKKNWLHLFGLGALLGFCYSQFLLLFFREIKEAIIEVIKVVRATAEVTISNY
eukprot:TRINITY_DN12852_c0_g3_i2.p2 TRINITY_DN12852_c0_g3~~TRINITY_DN12852_c0_g3_i2.p2  ORF type:complete len:167 (+),score=36.26 TRINITY_DN12852_c0_g3_i2:182-682(+)